MLTLHWFNSKISGRKWLAACSHPNRNTEWVMLCKKILSKWQLALSWAPFYPTSRNLVSKGKNLLSISVISYSLGWIHQHFEKLERTLFPLIVPRIHSTAVERLQLPETNCLQKSEPLLARERKETHIWELQNIKAHNTPVFSVVFELSAFKKKKKK